MFTDYCISVRDEPGYWGHKTKRQIEISTYEKPIFLEKADYKNTQVNETKKMYCKQLLQQATEQNSGFSEEMVHELPDTVREKH